MNGIDSKMKRGKNLSNLTNAKTFFQSRLFKILLTNWTKTILAKIAWSFKLGSQFLNALITPQTT